MKEEVLLGQTKMGKDLVHRNTNLDEKKLEKVMNQLADKKKEMVEQVFKILSERAKACL